MTPSTFALAAGLAAALLFGFPVRAQMLDRIDGPSTYDECVAEQMRGEVSGAREQSIRLACHNRFVLRLPYAAPPEQDPGYNPFVAWVADRDGSHGFMVHSSDPRAGGRFSRGLSDARADGLRRVQRLHRLATSRLAKISGSVSGFSTLTVHLHNHNGFPVTRVVLGLSEEEGDPCVRPLTDYPATLSCPSVTPKIEAGTEGKVSCRYSGTVDIVTLCIIGFESGFVRTDDFPAAMGIPVRP